MITKALMRTRAVQYRKLAAEAANHMLQSALIALAQAYDNLAKQLDSPDSVS